MCEHLCIFACVCEYVGMRRRERNKMSVRKQARGTQIETDKEN